MSDDDDYGKILLFYKTKSFKVTRATIKITMMETIKMMIIKDQGKIRTLEADKTNPDNQGKTDHNTQEQGNKTKITMRMITNNIKMIMEETITTKIISPLAKTKMNSSEK